MSTYEMRVVHTPKTSSLFGRIARLISLLRDVLDVFSEAQRQAHEAERRSPFATWNGDEAGQRLAAGSLAEGGG